MGRPDPLLAEQIAYYRAIAGEYEDHAIAPEGSDEILAALDTFAASGRVLELACGPGAWTERLLQTAGTLTAVDAAPEMISRARERVGHGVRFIEADLFEWQPDAKYDSIFFGFWISHVPRDRFAAFWATIADALALDGRVFFCDDNFRADEELIEGPASSTVERRLNDGTGFRAVKVPWQADELQRELEDLGWDIRVQQTSGWFYWGTGGRRA